MTKTINFHTRREEAVLINKIVARALRLQIGDTNAMALDMDITACHCNGMELDLKKLLSADDFNFCHDICGIYRHINRNTGEIENCFVPRCHAQLS